MTLDSATPMLQELIMVSKGYALDGLNYASLKMQKGMQRKSRSYGMSKFGFSFNAKTGKRTLMSSNHAMYGRRGRYYSRFSHKDGRQLHGLDQFIKFRVYDDSLKALVGFIDTKGFAPTKYRDGRAAGKMEYVKGQGGVKAIGRKMEEGGVELISDKQRKLFARSGWGHAAKKGAIIRKARPVVNPTFQAMRGQIVGILQEKYGKALAEHSAKTFQPRRTA